MKKITKLGLAKETVRALDRLELTGIAGGYGHTANAVHCRTANAANCGHSIAANATTCRHSANAATTCHFTL